MKNCETLYELLCGHEVVTCDAVPLLTIPYPDPAIRGFQGGCSDGERYYYQVLMHYEHADRSKDYSRIAKVDLKTMSVVKYSGVLHLDHANDVTYHKGTNRLIVTHNKPNYTRVSFVDPDTLEVTGTKELSLPLYALEYNEKRDLFVAGLSGTREFCFLDADMNPVDDRTYRTTPLTDRYTKQDVCCDDELLYFILWDGKHKELPDFQNLVAIYDYSGAYRGLLHFDVGPHEPESISIVSGEMIAVCDCGGPTLFRFDPKPLSE